MVQLLLDWTILGCRWETTCLNVPQEEPSVHRKLAHQGHACTRIVFPEIWAVFPFLQSLTFILK